MSRTPRTDSENKVRIKKDSITTLPSINKASPSHVAPATRFMSSIPLNNHRINTTKVYDSCESTDEIKELDSIKTYDSYYNLIPKKDNNSSLSSNLNSSSNVSSKPLSLIRSTTEEYESDYEDEELLKSTSSSIPVYYDSDNENSLYLTKSKEESYQDEEFYESDVYNGSASLKLSKNNFSPSSSYSSFDNESPDHSSVMYESPSNNNFTNKLKGNDYSEYDSHSNNNYSNANNINKLLPNVSKSIDTTSNSRQASSKIYPITNNPNIITSVNINPNTNSSMSNMRASKVTPSWITKGEWKLGDNIGKGSFGEVYKALNYKGKLIAVKKMSLSGNNEKSKNSIKLLCDEITLMRGLSHPNIVEYLGVTFDSATMCIYIFQEWVPGGSVSSILSSFGPLPINVIKNYTKQILSGLDYLHKNLIIHRDIKGGNLLVDDNGTVKLADFGASTQIEGNLNSTQDTETIKGTPYFMAPEVLKNAKYGRKGDIWAVGCTIIQMLTGDSPWKEFNLKSIFQLQFKIIQWKYGPPPITCHCSKCHMVSTVNNNSNILHSSLDESEVDVNPHKDFPNLSIKSLSPHCNNKQIISPSFSHFINMCFQYNKDDRPSAEELLKFHFLNEKSSDDLEDSTVAFNNVSLNSTANMNEEILTLQKNMNLALQSQSQLRLNPISTYGNRSRNSSATEDTLAMIEKDMNRNSPYKSQLNSPHSYNVPNFPISPDAHQNPFGRRPSGTNIPVLNFNKVEEIKYNEEKSAPNSARSMNSGRSSKLAHNPTSSRSKSIFNDDYYASEEKTPNSGRSYKSEDDYDHDSSYRYSFSAKSNGSNSRRPSLTSVFKDDDYESDSIYHCSSHTPNSNSNTTPISTPNSNFNNNISDNPFASNNSNFISKFPKTYHPGTNNQRPNLYQSNSSSSLQNNF